jgi:Interferon-induced transmembrane protein
VPPRPPVSHSAPSSHNGPGLAGAPVPNYLVQSILILLCCCQPFAIVALIFAAQVNSKLAAGDYAGAVDASRKAKLWCWISFALGIAGIVVAGLFGGAGILQAVREGMANR